MLILRFCLCLYLCALRGLPLPLPSVRPARASALSPGYHRLYLCLCALRGQPLPLSLLLRSPRPTTASASACPLTLPLRALCQLPLPLSAASTSII